MTAANYRLEHSLPRWPWLTGIGLLTIVTGWVVAVQPIIGLAVIAASLLIAGIVLIRHWPISRVGVALVGCAVFTAIFGPNLALPQASGVFAFRIIIVVLGLGTLAYLLLGESLKFPRSIGIPVVLLLLMTAWAVMSLAWATNLGAGIRWSSFFVMMVGLVIAMPIAFTTRRRVIRLLILLGIVFGCVTLVALIEVNFGIRLPTSRFAGVGKVSSFAATSVFGNENNFATYLTLTLPYLFCLGLIFRERRVRIIGGVLTAADLIALLFTGSKDNLIAMALVFLTVLIFLATDPRQRTRFLGLILIGIVALLVIIPSLNGTGLLPLPQRAVTKFSFTALQQEIASGQGSGAARTSLLKDGIGFVGDSGGIGVGAGNAETYVLNLPDFPGVSNLHDWWLEVTVNLGLVGLSLYVAFYGFLLTRAMRIARRAADPLIRYLSLAGTAALVGLVIGSLGPSTMIAFSPMWVTFGLILTTIAIADRAQRTGGRLQ